MRACSYGIFVLAVVHTLIHCAFASYPRRIPCMNETTPFPNTLTTLFDAVENSISFDWPTKLKCDLFTKSELKFYTTPLDESSDEETISFDLSPCRTAPECSCIKVTFRIPYKIGCISKVCLKFYSKVKKRSVCSSYIKVEIKKFSIATPEKEFRRERDQRIYGNFKVSIEPKLRAPLKVYVQMIDEAYYNNASTFDKNESISWDMIAVQEEDGHSQKSMNESCELVLIFDEECTIPIKIIGGAVFKFNVTNFSENEEETVPKATKPNEYTLKLVIPLSILASISLLGIMVKKRSSIRRNLRSDKNANQGLETLRSPMSNWNGSRMNLKLLLIYLKKSEQFMEAVIELKNLLCSQFPSSEVIDIFDEDYEKEFNIHGLNFIARLTREEYANSNVKIILIHSDETVHLLHKRGNLVEREENEKLIQFVNKDLMENPCQLKYNKVYNVCLEKFSLTHPNLRLYFNNLTLYYFPKHSELLCRDLCKYCSVNNV